MELERWAAAYDFISNASVRIVFCSISCALAEPVAGLALADRFTDNIARSPATRRMRGMM